MCSSALCLWLCFAAATDPVVSWLDIVVLSRNDPPPLLLLAAQQLRRYSYALDRRLPMASIAVVESAAGELYNNSNARVVVVLKLDEAICSQGCSFAVTASGKGVHGDAERGQNARIDIVGGDMRGQGVLHGVISLLRALGIGFGADGPPTLPPAAAARARAVLSEDATVAVGALLDKDSAAAASAAAALITAAASLHAAPAAAFEYRGFQPWGSYPMGNDWWDVDEYRRVIELIVNLRGNWVGMHNYGVNYGRGTEPGVWVGATAAAVSPSGNITTAGGYNASWSSTLRGLWGFGTTPTSAFPFGAASLFDHDCYGNRDVLSGDSTLCPYPQTQASGAEMFNRVGALYGSVFAFATELGVSTALGTETPLSIPSDPDALVPLLTWWSPVRDDTFVTTTQCSECPPDAHYVMIGVAGYVYAGAGAGRLPLNCYWAPDALDAWTGVGGPPSEAYAFVRTEGFVPPPGSNGATVPLFQVVRTYDKTVGPAPDTWAVSGVMVANATERGYAPVSMPFSPFAHIFAQPQEPFQSAPTFADPLVAAYSATFTRLERLYGRNLTWCVSPTDGCSRLFQRIFNHWPFTPPNAGTGRGLAKTFSGATCLSTTRSWLAYSRTLLPWPPRMLHPARPLASRLGDGS